ncbi:MAG: FAD-dependent oxidoreductase [Candidatus Micrarchaeota archaeon]
MDTYDVIIIGGGPAGISAAIYAARKKLKTLLLTQNIGGQVAWSSDVENYPGFTSIEGLELVSKFEEHMRAYEIEVRDGEDVSLVERTSSGSIRVKTSEAEYKARSAIICSGKTPRKLGAKGEEAFLKRGVAYCATCDAPMFANKPVAVIGGGNSALDAAYLLTKYASKVTILTIDPKLTGEEIAAEKFLASEKSELILNASIKEIIGDKFVTGVKYIHEGKEKQISANGVFIEIGLLPNSQLAPSLKKNEQKEIIVDSLCRTSVEGIFAAGDVTNVSEKQVIIAAGEGAKAALSAFSYLLKLRE